MPGFWMDLLGPPPPPRAALAGDAEADVAIVGAGYTGLWTAYYLKRVRPELSVMVLERETTGFGASGRNGGWVVGELAGSPEALAAGPAGRAGVLALRAAARATVEEVGRVVERERIDCDFHAGGTLTVATNGVQADRVRARLEHERAWGDEDSTWLDAGRLAERLRVAGAVGAMDFPHCARVQPAKLVRGLAQAVERLGVVIREHTTVTELRPGMARTEHGDVRARWVVRATEGYTGALPGLHRTLLPMNSSMIATDPLPEAAWREIGWEGAETLSDGANAYVYAQRTVDGRIAIGGRGRPYQFGSATTDLPAKPGWVEQLRATLVRLFPATESVELAGAWSGFLGVSRDWTPSVGADPRTGLAFAGGYAGEGVAAANLAGRILADLLAEQDTELTRLPIVDHRVRDWEPEPLRWLAVHGIYRLYRRADATEAATGRSSPLGRLADVVAGR